MNTFLFISWLCWSLADPLHQEILKTEKLLSEYKNLPTIFIANSTEFNDQSLEKLITKSSEKQLLEEKLKELRAKVQ